MNKKYLLAITSIICCVCICFCLSACDIITYLFSGNSGTVEFGSYPQTLVSDSAATSALNSLAGSLPTETESYGWTSYKYYQGTGSNSSHNDGEESNATDYMWYIDLTYGGDEYRGVYFTSYRPYYTTSESSASNSTQDENGYEINTLYWFKYEPVSWTILTEEEVDGATYQTILCTSPIDSQAFQNSYLIVDDYCYSTDSNGNFITDSNGEYVYANNYAYSSIRTWLNDTFYNTAFSSAEKESIQLVNIDNSKSSDYPCDDTNDYVWLLSYPEANNTNYGFNGNTKADEALQKAATDYAKCQGAYTSTRTDYAGNTYWWLRYGSLYSNVAYFIGDDGVTSYYNYVTTTDYGICPVIKIKKS